MNTMRRDPRREIASMREAMNNLIEEAFLRPRAGVAALAGGMPLDLRETDSTYIIETTLPGAKAENVDISVLGDSLRITAEIRELGDREGERWLIRERRFGRFERAITLPAQVKAEEANAEFNDGVLTIILPKAEVLRPRTIQVRAGSAETSDGPAHDSQEIDAESKPAE